jgi:curved DNA-binding protein CbpA
VASGTILIFLDLIL